MTINTAVMFAVNNVNFTFMARAFFSSPYQKHQNVHFQVNYYLKYFV